MKFSEVVAQTLAWLQREGRVSYRALRLEFDLNDDVLDALKEELIAVKELAVDKDGKMLVWVGPGINAQKDKGVEDEDSLGSNIQSLESKPSAYTPPHLAERIRAEQVALEARGNVNGERKTITALFADLKGSTALIEGLDPEDARAIIDPALQVMMNAVHRYEGYVAQVLGDGIFALFGAPIAHEDHPQRAVYAALRMQEEMRHYGDTLRQKGHPPLLMRVGVNTGEVVVRSIHKEDLHTDYVPVGHSTNLAARMEQLANPGAIVVSAYTHRLTDGYFAFKDLGKTQIKGVEEPLAIYEVLGAGPLRTRLQVSARRGLTRFVGRQSEMEQLQRALGQTKAGHGQIVGVMGEPGLGKSRLFYEFKLFSLSGCLVLEAYSVSHGKASAYLPVIELLKSYFRIESLDDERMRREKVIGRVLGLDRNLEDTLPYLLTLLGIEEQPSSLQPMDPQIRRRRTFEALKKLFLRESLTQPLVLIFEDLHWIDSETQGFLDTLSESVASAKILLLVNYRPEYRHEWEQKTYYTQLRLAPFGKAEAEEFLDVLLGVTVGAGARSPLHDLKQLILEKTEGTPFFMEEVVQTLAEEGILVGDHSSYRLTRHTTTMHVPTTVQGVLAARIDRLNADEKALLQQLAVIGREFPVSLVRQVLVLPEDELYRLLASLQRKEFLYEQPAFPEVEYLFKHALTQEVAYSSVLHERRKALHERTAQAIEAVFPARLEDHYSDLAHHYSRSKNTAKAVHYLHLAGQQAVQRSANAEAIRSLTTALAFLKTLPDTPAHAQQELALQIALGVPLMVTKGWSAPEVEHAYVRAQELCERLGETRQLFSALRGLWECYELQGKLAAARELGERLLNLAESSADPALLLVAHDVLADNLYWEGQFVAARAHAEQGTALYNRQQHHVLAALYGGYDPGVACLSFEALSWWALGYPDRSAQKMRDMLTLAQELPPHPYSLTWARVIAAWLSQYRRDRRAVLEHAEATIALSTMQAFPVHMAGATVPQGWALAKRGEQTAGLARVRQGLGLWQTMGSELIQSYFLALLAETYGELGQAEEGLAVVAEAMEGVRRTGEQFWEAELYRLKGEFTLQWAKLQDSRTHDAEAEAEECFLKAIDLAQKQQAKSLELRTVVSLSRLWQQLGKQKEAHAMLSAIYGWFTEGFDTKDLQEAKALLDELAEGR